MRFALITEGVSENRIIKQILTKFFKDDDLLFRDAQPQIVNDKQETIGGWNEVLKFCGRTEDLKEIFRNSDYLVIQIDTDMCQTKPFDVSHYDEQNRLKSLEQLHSDVVSKMKSLINSEILDEKGANIIFAICIHSIECWLLPIYIDNNHKSDIHKCISTLNNELRRQNIATISAGSKNSVKSINSYDKILINWKKKKHLLESAQHNPSFLSFLNSLEEISEKVKQQKQ